MKDCRNDRTTELREKLAELEADVWRSCEHLTTTKGEMLVNVPWEKLREWLAIAATMGSEREKRLEKLVDQLWYLVNHRSGYGYAAALEAIEELGIEVNEYH